MYWHSQSWHEIKYPVIEWPRPPSIDLLRPSGATSPDAAYEYVRARDRLLPSQGRRILNSEKEVTRIGLPLSHAVERAGHGTRCPMLHVGRIVLRGGRTEMMRVLAQSVMGCAINSPACRITPSPQREFAGEWTSTVENEMGVVDVTPCYCTWQRSRALQHCVTRRLPDSLSIFKQMGADHSK